MFSLPILTLNSLSFVDLRREFCPLKFPHWSKWLPIDEGSFLLSGHERSENLLFPLGRTGVFRKTPLLPIPERGVEV
jgi:hypothetical protein